MSRAQSRAVRAIGPTQSSECESGMTPARLTRVTVGLSPVTPHIAAGWRNEPPVSVPKDAKIIRAATAAVVLVVAARAEGELGHVQRADVDRAGCVQSLEHARRQVGNKIPPDLGAAGDDLALAVEEILVRERHAVQGASRRPLLALAVGLLGGERKQGTTR